MPFTTKTGSIAVATALASEQPASGVGETSFFAGVSLAAVAVSAASGALSLFGSSSGVAWTVGRAASRGWSPS